MSIYSHYCWSQVVTILANLSVLEQCASEVLQEQGNIFFTCNDICYFFWAKLQLTFAVASHEKQ